MSSSKPAGQRACEQWTDRETRALVRVWGQLYLDRHKGSLSARDWRQVCHVVNSHRAIVAAGRPFNRRCIDQCKSRLTRLKDRYKKELAKGETTPGWRHFAQLGAFLDGPDGPPPGFAPNMPAASLEEEGVVEDATSSVVGRRTVPSKRPFSCLQDTLHRCRTRMPASATEEEEEVGGDVPASAGCNPTAVLTDLVALATKLTEVCERVVMEKLSMEKMAMKTKKRAANPGETDGAN